MKAKLLVWSGAGLLALLGTSWGAYHAGFERGYSRGAHDEFARWKQEPVKIGASWDGMVTGRRSMRAKAKCYIAGWRPWPVNSCSAPFSFTGPAKQ